MSIDFATPAWLIYFYHVLGTVSLLINSGIFYLLIFKSEKIDSFRYYLLVFQIICTLTDVHFTIFMQPVPFFPIIAVYCNGVLARVLNPHYLLVFWTFLNVAQVSSLVFCFAVKHKSIRKATSGKTIPKKIYNHGAFLFILVPFLVGLCAFKTGIEKDYQMEFVMETYPQYIQDFLKLENFSIYVIDKWFATVITLASIGAFFSGSTFIFTTIDMLKMLKGLKLKVSSKSFRRYRSAVRSLLGQFMTSSLCLIPPSAIMLLAIGRFDNGQVLVQLAFGLSALHSSVNAVVLVATTTPYRQFVLRFGRKKKVKFQVFQISATS